MTRPTRSPLVPPAPARRAAGPARPVLFSGRPSGCAAWSAPAAWSARDGVRLLGIALLVASFVWMHVLGGSSAHHSTAGLSTAGLSATPTASAEPAGPAASTRLPSAASHDDARTDHRSTAHRYGAHTPGGDHPPGADSGRPGEPGEHTMLEALCLLVLVALVTLAGPAATRRRARWSARPARGRTTVRPTTAVPARAPCHVALGISRT